MEKGEEDSSAAINVKDAPADMSVVNGKQAPSLILLYTYEFWYLKFRQVLVPILSFPGEPGWE